MLLQNHPEPQVNDVFMCVPVLSNWFCLLSSEVALRMDPQMDNVGQSTPGIHTALGLKPKQSKQVT